jgi:glutathione S-transferase
MIRMLELFQAEWCPHSQRVRQRLTELGLDYVARQVPVAREARFELRAAVGADTIPALRLENGSAVVGEANILTLLDESFAEPTGAEAHRHRATNLRRRFLEEECPCKQRAPRRARRTKPSRASRTTGPR